MIHSVIFSLKYAPGSSEEAAFLAAASELAAIPMVENLRCYRQVSPKNSFAFGLSMEFASHAAFAAYCVHPLHEQFVTSRWIPEVSDFLEIDYVAYEARK